MIRTVRARITAASPATKIAAAAATCAAYAAAGYAIGAHHLAAQVAHRMVDVVAYYL